MEVEEVEDFMGVLEDDEDDACVDDDDAAVVAVVPLAKVEPDAELSKCSLGPRPKSEILR